MAQSKYEPGPTHGPARTQRIGGRLRVKFDLAHVKPQAAGEVWNGVGLGRRPVELEKRTACLPVRPRQQSHSKQTLVLRTFYG